MDFSSYLRFLLALIFVLALIVLVSWLVRRFGLAGTVAIPRGRPGKRLGIVEILPIDPKRRLVLLTRDGVEHLVMLGATGETVIERHITPPAAQEPATEPVPIPPSEAQPR